MKHRIFHRFSLMAVGLIPFFFLTDSFSQEKTWIHVAFENERRTTSLTGLKKEDVLYASLGDLAGLLSVRTFSNPENKKLVLRVGSQAIKVTSLNPFIVVDDAVYQMAFPTIDVDGEIYVPLAIFLETVGGYFPAEFDFERDSKSLRIRRLKYNITGVEVEEKLNGSLIRFVTTKEFKVTDVATSFNRGWLYVTFFGGILDTTRIASERRMGIVKKIVSFQFETSAQVSFLLDGEVTDRQVYVDEGEVLVSMRSTRQFDTAIINSPEADRRRWLIDRIIIDPGHGGKDPGAIGRTGTKEKDINLDIAKRLKKLLEEELKVDVLMTRKGDTFVGLKERTKFANANEGKLFISIHCNSIRSRRIRGFKTYILGPARTQQALEVAEKENSVIELEESTEVYDEFQDAAHILNEINQSTNLKESEDLARIVNEEFKRRTKIPQWGTGVDQTGFYVLIGAAMPRILVETAFLSNAYEERLLKTKSERRKIARALFESIKQFKEKYERGIG